MTTNIPLFKNMKIRLVQRHQSFRKNLIHRSLLLLISTFALASIANLPALVHGSDDSNIVENNVCTDERDQTCVAKHDQKVENESLYDDDDNMFDDDDDDDYEDDDDDEYDEKLEPKSADTSSDDIMENECVDNDKDCEFWAAEGECDKNSVYMHRECAKSCKQCANSSQHGARFGEGQNIDSKNPEGVLNIIKKMESYMEEEVNVEGNGKIFFKCKNRHKDCAYWALLGECEENPKYMTLHCAPVCHTCHLLDVSTRCPIPPDAVNALGPGDLNKLFERIVDGEDAKLYNSNVLSRPTYPPGINEENADFKLGPWVITIDDFVKDEECEKLIELGAVEGYERSENVVEELFDGTFGSKQSKTRTSHNAWCQDECYEDPFAKAVMDRIEKLTGIPEKNSEHFQLLRYYEGQFYRTHHDYIDGQDHFPAGPRILTAFLYLNDVEEGGGTNFPSLGITVTPKKGRLLLWPSVQNSDPFKEDKRTKHQALAVEKGIKYAANAWIHLRDFKTPNDTGCT